MSKKKRVGIITGGGDCPGLNAVIDSAVKCLENDYEILGFYKGFEGLLNKDYILLDRVYTNSYRFSGGTILKSVNSGNFPGKIGLGEKSLIQPEIVAKTIENYNELGLEGLIVLGGDGTLTVAQEFYQRGLNIVGVPKSIDNDLQGTDFTFGFLTAVDIATDALDRLDTTAYSHDRVMILEVMGRNAGWIGLYSGLAGGANMILIPEIPFRWESVLEVIENRYKQGKTSSLIVVSEGAMSQDGKVYTSTSGGKSSETLLGGIGDEIARFLNNYPEIDSRCTRLGHVQRGGTPNAIDRILSRQFGAYAAQLFKNKEYGQMVIYRNNTLESFPIKSSISKLKSVEKDGMMVKLARNMGVSFGD